jgi:hypothetical protein
MIYETVSHLGDEALKQTAKVKNSSLGEEYIGEWQ